MYTGENINIEPKADNSSKWDTLKEVPFNSANNQQTSSKLSLKGPLIKVRNEDGTIIEKYAKPTGTYFSYFNRYPQQIDNVKQLMHESYESGKPLKVLNIGVSQGQEAMSYIQAASDIAGENNIDDALDLELVEYTLGIQITNGKLPKNISESSRSYLKKLYQTNKAHFGTPFQEYAKELKEKGEKRNVVLFNNVIQHLDYKNKTEEEMLKDMENLADIIDENGILCMYCDKNARSMRVESLLNSTTEMLKSRGFHEEAEDIFRKSPQKPQVTMA